MNREDADEWLDIARKTYEDSTSYMNANLRHQWEDNIRMFKNKHPSGSKYNTELYQKRSRLFRPKTRSASIQFDAAVSSAFFSTAELSRTIPEDKNDKLAVAGAAVVSDLLSYRLTETMPWMRTVIGAGQEAWKMGHIISHQGWEYEVDSEGNVIKDQPAVTLITAENFRLDPAANWADPIGSSPYHIWIDHLYVSDIKARIRLGDEGKSAGWLPVTEGEMTAARDFSFNTTQQQRDPNTATTKDPRPIRDYDLIPVHKNFVTKDGKQWVYYTLANSTMLSEPELVTDEYPQGIPFVMGNLLATPFTVYQEGQPEIGQPVQEELNYVANDRLDNVHLVLNKRYFAKRGRNVDFRSLLRNIPGSITMMDDPSTDVEVISTPDITQSAYVEQDKLDTDYDNLIGTFSPATINATGANAGNGSVGGMGMAQAGSASITEFMLRTFRETWVEPVIRQLLLLELAFESEETINTVVRDKESLQIVKDSGVDVEEFMAKLRVHVNVGISSTNPQMKVEKLLYAMQSMGQIYASPMASRVEIDELATEIFGSLGFRDGSRFLKDDDVDPMVTQLQQQVQELTAQIESKQLELDKKYQIDRDKLDFEIGKYQAEEDQRNADLQASVAAVQKDLASTQKLMAEAESISTGAGDELEVARLQLEYARLAQKSQEFMIANNSDRDKVLAAWEMKREELEAKLQIVIENNKKNDGDAGKDVSKDTATVSKNAIEDAK